MLTASLLATLAIGCQEDPLELLTGPRLSWHQHDPAELVRVVNRLHAMGRERTLAILEEYLELSPSLKYLDEKGERVATTPDPNIVHAVVCCLFDEQDEVPRPTDAREEFEARQEMTLRARFRSFPILFLHGLPIWALQTRGGVLLPGYESQRGHNLVVTFQQGFLAWARDHGRFRDAPLRPPDDPLDAVERYFADETNKKALRKLFVSQLEGGAEGENRENDDSRSFESYSQDHAIESLESSARHQAYNAVKSLLDDDVTRRLGFSPSDSSMFEDEYWEIVREVASKRDFVWDAETASYRVRQE